MAYQLFPELTDEEYKDLKEDIAKRGVQVPVELDEHGNILDGHHRVKICKELNIKDYPIITRFDLSEQEKRVHIRKLNIARRHLSCIQKRELIEEQLKESPEISDRQIAEDFKVSNKTVSETRKKLEEKNELCKLHSSRGKDGKVRPRSIYSTRDKKEKITTIAEKKPQLINKIDDGEKTIDSVFNGIIKEEEKQKRIEELQKKAENFEETDAVRVIKGDFRDVKIEPESVNAIITDPPYTKEFVPLWSPFAEFASKVLVPGGYLIAYSWVTCLPQIYNILSEHLEYFWTLSLIYKTPYINYPTKTFNRFNVILVYYKPPLSLPEEYFNDVIFGPGKEKDFHNWQKPESELYGIIDKFTKPNDLILDPFAGSGSTLSACLKKQRRVIGIEINEYHIQTIRGRLSNATNEIINHSPQYI